MGELVLAVAGLVGALGVIWRAVIRPTVRFVRLVRRQLDTIVNRTRDVEAFTRTVAHLQADVEGYRAELLGFVSATLANDADQERRLSALERGLRDTSRDLRQLMPVLADLAHDLRSK